MGRHTIGRMHTTEICKRKRHTQRGTYTRSGPTHGRDIHMKGCTLEATYGATYTARDIHFPRPVYYTFQWNIRKALLDLCKT